MTPAMKSISDALRDAIRHSGESRFAIAKATGVAESILSRFMHGSSMRTETVDRLAGHLGLELRSTASSRKGKG